jgi:hypothetical protein
MGGCEKLIKKHMYPSITTYLSIGYPNKTISLLGSYKLNIYCPIIPCLEIFFSIIKIKKNKVSKEIHEIDPIFFLIGFDLVNVQNNLK